MQRNTDHPRFEPLAFDATRFAGVGTITAWTVALADQLVLGKLLFGNLMELFFNIENSTIAGVADTTIRYLLPTGEPLPARTMNLTGLYAKTHGIAAGAFVPVRALITAGSPNIDLTLLHGQVIYATQVISNPPTQAEVQAIDDALAVATASPGAWTVGADDTDVVGSLLIPIEA